jgi:hypothetical protein
MPNAARALVVPIKPKPALLIWRSPRSMHHRQSTAVLGEQRHLAFRHVVRHAAVAERADQAAAVSEALVLGELAEDLIGRAPDLQLGEKIDEAVEAVLPDVLGVSHSCRVEFGTGFLPPEIDAQKALETMSPSRELAMPGGLAALLEIVANVHRRGLDLRRAVTHVYMSHFAFDI